MRLLRKLVAGKTGKAARIIRSGLFDRNWYERQAERRFASEHKAAEDYLTNGVAAGFDPNPLFETAWYLEQNPDVREAGLNPLLHYAENGWREGREPGRDFSAAEYLKIHPDVAAAGHEPLSRFLAAAPDAALAERTAPIPKRDGGNAGPRPLKLDPNARLVRDPRLRAYADCRAVELAPESKIFDPDRLRLHWVIPDFNPGAGGHMTIFRIIRLLEDAGHDISIWISCPSVHKTPEDARRTIREFFQPIESDVRFASDGLMEASGDAVIATDFWTVWPMLGAANFKRRFYFVQDYEPLFHPMGTEHLIALDSYRQGLDCICASPWLEGLMRNRHGLWARSFNLAVDHDIYHPAEETGEAAIGAEPLNIAFYARHTTPRRAVRLGLLGLEKLAATTTVPFHVHFFGAREVEFSRAPFPATDHGVLSPDGLAALYRDCDVGLVFSTTNYSLVPQEMMACRLPVIEVDGDSTRAVFPDGVAALTPPNPLAIASTLDRVLRDKSGRDALARNGCDWAQGLNWSYAANSIAQAIAERLSEQGFSATPAQVSKH